MNENREQYIGRRIAEEMRETRRVIKPWLDEVARLHAMTLTPGVMTENGEWLSAPPPPVPPAIQELCDRESARLEARVAALQAGDMFPIWGEPRPAMIG